LQLPNPNLRNIPIGYSANTIFSIDYQQFPSRQQGRAVRAVAGRESRVSYVSAGESLAARQPGRLDEAAGQE
jgi:hypothetical protein